MMKVMSGGEPVELGVIGVDGCRCRRWFCRWNRSYSSYALMTSACASPGRPCRHLSRSLARVSSCSKVRPAGVSMKIFPGSPMLNCILTASLI